MLSFVEKKLYEYCENLNIQIQELSILLSFSGGIDSTIMASLLLEMRNAFKFKLGFAHFNHHAHNKSGKIEDTFTSFTNPSPPSTHPPAQVPSQKYHTPYAPTSQHKPASHAQSP